MDHQELNYDESMLEIWQMDMMFHWQNKEQQPMVIIKEASVRLL